MTGIIFIAIQLSSSTNIHMHRWREKQSQDIVSVHVIVCMTLPARQAYSSVTANESKVDMQIKTNK